MRNTPIVDILPSQITPRADYLGRRRMLRGMAALPWLGAVGSRAAEPAVQRTAALANIVRSAYTGEAPSSHSTVVNYALFREFGEGAELALKNAPAMATRPWTVSVEGECLKPARWDIEALLKLAPLQERIYRHRCVDGWYMVVPWVGYALNELIRQAQPTGNAKYVEFSTHHDTATMTGDGYPWPYIESLRLDEAMHPLTLLTFGLYGEVLPNAKGAPLRLVVPWKIAHKSPKSLVRIRFTEQQPKAFFYTLYPQYYGYYRNVHPGQWQLKSQAKERRISEFFRTRDTQLLNGYADQVASLYGSELNTLR